MIVIATIAHLTRMFKSFSSAWEMSWSISLSFNSSFVFIIITSKYIIVISNLLKLLLVRNLIKLFFLVPVWINADIAVFLLHLLFMWITSLFKGLLLLLLCIVKVLRRFMVLIIWHLTHDDHLLLSHTWMSLIIRIMLLIILLRLSMLLRSVVRNCVLNLTRLLMLLLELRSHFASVAVWNGLSHADDCWNLPFILRWSIILRNLFLLPLVIIIISISINALWWLRIILIMAMWILIIRASGWLSGTKLLIAGIKLFCHRLINGLSNCTIITFAILVVLAHEVMIIHIFLNASWWSTWLFNIALIYVLDLLDVSLYHIEVSCFEFFSFLKKTCLLNVS